MCCFCCSCYCSCLVIREPPSHLPARGNPTTSLPAPHHCPHHIAAHTTPLPTPYHCPCNTNDHTTRLPRLHTNSLPQQNTHKEKQLQDLTRQSSMRGTTFPQHHPIQTAAPHATSHTCSTHPFPPNPTHRHPHTAQPPTHITPSHDVYPPRPSRLEAPHLTPQRHKSLRICLIAS